MDIVGWTVREDWLRKRVSKQVIAYPEGSDRYSQDRKISFLAALLVAFGVRSKSESESGCSFIARLASLVPPFPLSLVSHGKVRGIVTSTAVLCSVECRVAAVEDQIGPRMTFRSA